MSNFAFSSLSDVLNMDGHGVYVWAVFSLFLITISTSFYIFNLLIKKYQERVKWKFIEKKDS